MTVAKTAFRAALTIRVLDAFDLTSGIGMYRYCALLWNSEDPQQTADAALLARRFRSLFPAWVQVLDQSGACVFYVGACGREFQAYALQGNGGVVLGTLFKRNNGDEFSPETVTLSAHLSSAILSSNGRHLMSSHWGRYVAVLLNGSVGAISIVRDPSGVLPCFITKCRGIHIAFSDIAVILQLESQRFSVNWEHVTALLESSSVRVRSTGLNEVSELLPGECLRIRGGAVSKSLYWNPTDIAASDPIEDPSEARALLKRTVLACVHAWASCYDRIVFALSGGLDSSIVLSCLKRAPTSPEIVCFNHFTQAAEADERRYAHLMVQHVRCECVEHLLDVRSVRLERILDIAPSARPGFYLHYVLHGEFEADLASRRGATAIFSGGGGDTVFLQSPGEFAVADYLVKHGIGPRLFSAARDNARVTGQSIWYMLHAGVRRALVGGWAQWDRTRPNTTFLHPDVLSTSRNRAQEPIRRSGAGVPAGKLRHVAAMLATPALYDPLGDQFAPQRVTPLLSQPLVELCIRIPTYVLIHGGIDRALARAAFAQDLPPLIIRRRSKGFVNRDMKELLETNIHFLRELLLDGVLVRRKLLDRKRLEAYFQGPRPDMGTEHHEILSRRLSMEAWVRGWAEHDGSKAHGLERAAMEVRSA